MFNCKRKSGGSNSDCVEDMLCRMRCKFNIGIIGILFVWVFYTLMYLLFFLCVVGVLYYATECVLFHWKISSLSPLPKAIVLFVFAIMSVLEMLLFYVFYKQYKASKKAKAHLAVLVAMNRIENELLKENEQENEQISNQTKLEYIRRELRTIVAEYGQQLDSVINWRM